MTDEELAKHDKTFYAFWEKIFDEMPDDVLESTMVMMRKYNALTQLVKEERAYRSAGREE